MSFEVCLAMWMVALAQAPSAPTNSFGPLATPRDRTSGEYVLLEVHGRIVNARYGVTEDVSGLAFRVQDEEFVLTFDNARLRKVVRNLQGGAAILAGQWEQRAGDQRRHVLRVERVGNCDTTGKSR